MDSMIENIYVSRELYSLLFAPVCVKYGVTLTEILVLLSLSNGGGGDTAKDIVRRLGIAKSHVSVSVRDLEERGYVKGGCEGNDRRLIHLHVCERAADVIAESRAVQQQIHAIMEEGLSPEERETLVRLIGHITDNANAYLEHARAGTGGRQNA